MPFLFILVIWDCCSEIGARHPGQTCSFKTGRPASVLVASRCCQASAERVRVLQFDWVLQAPFSGFLRKAGNPVKVRLSVCLSTGHLLQTEHTF